MKKLMLCLSVALAACAAEAYTTTKQECLDAGGHGVSNPGPLAQCPEGEEQIGSYPEGVEGAICCR
jgi:hypothetical protein